MAPPFRQAGAEADLAGTREERVVEAAFDGFGRAVVGRNGAMIDQDRSGFRGIPIGQQKVGNGFDDIVESAVAREQAAVAKFNCRCPVPTARGGVVDFVSRAFAPRYGIPEDPVTGSAHCALAPYWAGVLGKDDLLAFQVSARGGEVRYRVAGDRVQLAGQAAVFIEGTIHP